MLMEVPLRYPPPGGISDFTTPVFLGKPVVVTAAICLPLMIFFGTVRVYARTVMLKRWRLDDYVYSIAWVLALAMIIFTVTIVFATGRHAWDIDRFTMPKSSILGLIAFWTALGPMLWIIKLAFFSFLLSNFGSIRWLKNCAWVGIIVTGLLFAPYPIVVTLSCGPTPSTDAQSYLNGLNRLDCTSAGGTNAIVSIATSVANGVSNSYLLVISYPLISTLSLERKAMRGVYVVYVVGVLALLCSLLGAGYRITSWQSDDITGNQIPFYITFIIESSLSLIIPCLPSAWLVYRHLTLPDIDDTTTLATSKQKSLSTSPQTDSRSTWRKTNDLEELPFRKTSSEYSGPRDSRMKALPTTPLPITPLPMATDSGMPELKTPTSTKSMRLPIMFFSSSSSTYSQ